MPTIRQKKLEIRRLKKLKRRKAYERLRNYNKHHEISVGEHVVSHAKRSTPTVSHVKANVFTRAVRKLFRRKVI